MSIGSSGMTNSLMSSMEYAGGRDISDGDDGGSLLSARTSGEVLVRPG